MIDKQIIIDGIDVSRCEYRDWRNSCHCDNSKENEGEKRVTGRGGCKYNPNCYYKQLKRKEQECEELHNRTASIIYNLTGGRLSYSTYTLEGCADAYRDQLSIDVERATKELEEENETLKQELNTFKQALNEIEKYLDAQQKYFDGEDYHNLLDIINKVKDSK